MTVTITIIKQHKKVVDSISVGAIIMSFLKNFFAEIKQKISVIVPTIYLCTKYFFINLFI